MGKLNLENEKYNFIDSLASYGKEILLENNKICYFSIDTIFLASGGIDKMWNWFHFTLYPMIDAAINVSKETNPYRFHRVFIIPYGKEIANPFRRQEYRDIVKMTLHYHLWHGVVCYAIFINSKDYPSKSELRNIDFGGFSNQIVFDSSGFYSDSFSKKEQTLEKNKADEHIKASINLINREDLKHSIQLFYDEKTFQNGRRNHDSQYENLRKFLYLLHDGKCSVPDEVHDINYSESSIDHIIPQGNSNNILVNLDILCKKHNSLKWKYNIKEDPLSFASRKLPEFANKYVYNTFHEIPSWINRINSKPKNIFRLLNI